MFQATGSFALKDITLLENQEYAWKMSDMYSTSGMIDTLSKDAETALQELKEVDISVNALQESMNACKYLSS